MELNQRGQESLQEDRLSTACLPGNQKVRGTSVRKVPCKDLSGGLLPHDEAPWTLGEPCCLFFKKRLKVHGAGFRAGHGEGALATRLFVLKFDSLFTRQTVLNVRCRPIKVADATVLSSDLDEVGARPHHGILWRSRGGSQLAKGVHNQVADPFGFVQSFFV